MALEYALFRRGPLTMAPSQMGGFTRSAPEHATPNIEFHVQPLSLDKFGEPLHRFPAFTATACNLRPLSRGHVRLKCPIRSRRRGFSPISWRIRPTGASPWMPSSWCAVSCSRAKRLCAL